MKPVFKKRLVDLVGDIDLLSILANHENSFDQHLDDLMEFFSNVASNQITPLAKLQFIKSLQTESFNVRKRGALHSGIIPCPTLIQLPCELHPSSTSPRFRIPSKLGCTPWGWQGSVHVGIHSEAYFADFCKLNDQERDDLFLG